MTRRVRHLSHTHTDISNMKYKSLKVSLLPAFLLFKGIFIPNDKRCSLKSLGTILNPHLANQRLNIFRSEETKLSPKKCSTKGSFTQCFKICFNLGQTTALKIIKTFSNYLQCNLAFCNSCCNLRLVARSELYNSLHKME